MTDERVNIAYVSSVREIGTDELVGQRVIDPESGKDYGYRMGSLEHLARLLIEGTHPFAQTCNLAAIFVDDSDEQWDHAWSKGDIWPQDLKVPFRDAFGNVTRYMTLADLTIRESSLPWRSIRNPEERLTTKTNYERTVTKSLTEKNVDLLVSDSHLSILLDPSTHPAPDGLLLSVYNGRAINVHPAITALDNPNRLPGVTPTRDAYTRASYGWIIVDDKHAVDHPAGEVFQVDYQGKSRTAVRVPRSYTTGVTVHEMIGAVDNGTVVYAASHELQQSGLTYESIRAKNYVLKNRILPEAIVRYAKQDSFQQRLRKAKAER